MINVNKILNVKRAITYKEGNTHVHTCLHAKAKLALAKHLGAEAEGAGNLGCTASSRPA